MKKADLNKLAHQKQVKERSIKKSYSLTESDVGIIERAKDKSLNRKIVLTDSQVVRMGLATLASFSETDLVKLAERVPKLSGKYNSK